MNDTDNDMAPRDKLAACMASLGITVDAVFVPFSQSRNKAEKFPSLNWRVTLKVKGRDVIETDYMAGSGHAPSYKQPGWGARTNEDRQRDADVAWECENGRAYNAGRRRGAPILPDPVDVVWSLVQDAGALDYATFEEWADNYGYDTDSRKAEAIYRACLDIATRLRAAVGNDGLEALREAGDDF